eukprot:SAG22_NODE_2128_length_2969_cov_46.413937_5_plen_222_part_00
MGQQPDEPLLLFFSLSFFLLLLLGLAQPLLSVDGDLILAANGEIYNHMELKATILKDATFLTGSDCEVIIPLYQKFGAAGLKDICASLDGVFAFVLYDADQDVYVAGRDPIGVNPLYIGWTKEGVVMVRAWLGLAAAACMCWWLLSLPGRWAACPASSPALPRARNERSGWCPLEVIRNAHSSAEHNYDEDETQTPSFESDPTATAEHRSFFVAHPARAPT